MTHPLGLQINPGSKKEKQREKEPRSWSDPCLACLGHRNALRFSCLPGCIFVEARLRLRVVPGLLVELVKSGLNAELGARGCCREGGLVGTPAWCQRPARGAWRGGGGQRWQTQRTATAGEALWGCKVLFHPCVPREERGAIPGQREMSPGEGAAWRQRHQPKAQQPGDALGCVSIALLRHMQPLRAWLGHGVAGAGAAGSPLGAWLSSGFKPHLSCQPGLSPPCSQWSDLGTCFKGAARGFSSQWRRGGTGVTGWLAAACFPRDPPCTANPCSVLLTDIPGVSMSLVVVAVVARWARLAWEAPPAQVPPSPYGGAWQRLGTALPGGHHLSSHLHPHTGQGLVTTGALVQDGVTLCSPACCPPVG